MILLLIFLSPSLFCPIDMLYYIFSKKRTLPRFRLVFEVIVLGIIPFLGCNLRLSEGVLELITPEVFYLLSVLCIICYFITSYSNAVTFTSEVLYTVAILSGYIINIITFFTLYDNHTSYFSSLIAVIGCTPIFFLLSTALIQQFRRCKSMYKPDYTIEV